MRVGGKTAIGSTAIELAADTKRVAFFDVSGLVWVPKLTAYIDGAGAGAGDQVMRGVIYDPSDQLIGLSNEVVIPYGSPPLWVDFPFPIGPHQAVHLTSGAYPDLGGCLLPATGRYRFGVHVGPISNGARIYGDPTSPLGGKWNADAYAGGTATTFGAATSVTSDLSIFATYSTEWVQPNETDEYFAQLPLELAQQVLGEAGPVASYSGAAGWHGTKIDPERGSFCVVKTDGPLAGLVGERVKVTSLESAGRSVVAYVHNESSELTEDLSLSRRLYLALALLSTDSVSVRVEVLG